LPDGYTVLSSQTSYISIFPKQPSDCTPNRPCIANFGETASVGGMVTYSRPIKTYHCPIRRYYRRPLRIPVLQK